MKRDRTTLIDTLLKSDEPSVRWKVMTRVVGEDPEARKVRELREEIRTSPRARALIAERDTRFVREAHVYASWRGAHWTLAMLAEIGYPAGDYDYVPVAGVKKTIRRFAAGLERAVKLTMQAGEH